MSYPGSFIKYVDNSAIPTKLPITETDNSPLFGAVFTSDMGPEDWTTVKGDEFFELFGHSVSFIKHGQPLLQAAMMINNGAKLYCKRVVANDSAYANLGVIATISDAVEAGQPVTNLDNQPLYYKKDPDTGNNLEETTTNTQTHMNDERDVDNDPVLTTASPASVTYEAFSVENAKTVEEVYAAFKKEYNLAAKKFPLFIFVENGRGVSNKSWSITPNYELSKNSKYMVYTLTIDSDGSKSTVTFTFNPDYILDGKSFCLQQRVLNTSKQLKCQEFDSYINEFIEAMATAMSTEEKTVTVTDIKNQDILFGNDRKGNPLSTEEVFTYSSDGIAMDSAYGNKLINGSNGAFNNNPIDCVSESPDAETYEKAMVRAFDEDLYPEVWDNENNKIIAIFDAAYPKKVKAKIEELAIWREDFLYFEDFGITGLTNFNEIDEVFKGTEDAPGVAKSMFVKPYPLYGVISDPYTQKDITVSICYLLALKFISHCANGINNPFCGIRYGVTFPEIKYGTLNFIPSVTPKFDQKTQMVDERLNYCAYHNELLVMETDYTSLEEYTQWSFGCNVAATQAVVRAIRTICPANRYALATNAGLAAYQEDIENKVIKNYVDWFSTLTFEYTGDELTLANKQYYASLAVKFVDFIQEEYFTVTALPSVSSAE